MESGESNTKNRCQRLEYREETSRYVHRVLRELEFPISREEEERDQRDRRRAEWNVEYRGHPREHKDKECIEILREKEESIQIERRENK